MSSDPDIPLLRRPAFFGGQQLTAADLTAAQVFQRELRWLHNRSLHNWGIAFGYAVSGARGESSVRVGQGLALDCMGRELILTQDTALPIPSVAGAADAPVPYYLTVSYADDAGLTPEMRAGACATGGAVRRAEVPVIRWQSPGDIEADSRYRYGLDIIIASVAVRNCRLAEDVSLAARRSAVPPPQPYVAAGHTPVKETEWHLWPKQKPVGVMTKVSTLGAGFQTGPQYQAHVVGKRIFDGTLGNKKQHFVVDGPSQLAAATATDFELRVILPAGAFAGKTGARVVTAAGLRAHVLFHLAQGDDAILDLIYVINLLDAQSLSLAVGQQLLVPQSIAHGAVNFLYSLENLAEDSGSTVEAILLANGLDSANQIQMFQDLIVPAQLSTHTLTFADFKELLEGVAAQAGTEVGVLMEANGLTAQALTLKAGQSLLVPGEALEVNPPAAVLTQGFMSVLRKQLGWHVVWMGTEG